MSFGLPTRCSIRPLAVAMAWLMAYQAVPAAAQEQPRPKLNIVVVEGEGAINNVRQRTAREPIVQVEDENRKPVAGASVTFLLPRDGAGIAMKDGSRSFTAATDQNGRATLRGIRPNHLAGQFQITVTASYQGMTASTVITQTNAIAGAAAAGAGVGAGAAGGISGKLIAVIAVAAAAAAGGAMAATRGGGSPTNTAAAVPITVTPGTPAVGSPR